MGISDEKLFIQFYLLLFVCFLVMSLRLGWCTNLPPNARANSRWMIDEQFAVSDAQRIA